jgi:hypothetical protein
VPVSWPLLKLSSGGIFGTAAFTFQQGSAYIVGTAADDEIYLSGCTPTY